MVTYIFYCNDYVPLHNFDMIPAEQQHIKRLQHMI